MDDTLFEKLERLNVQIDIWIDQEEYDDIINSFQFSQALSTEHLLAGAFEHDNCTNYLQERWDNLLGITSQPFTQFKLRDEWISFPQDKIELVDKWGLFFWAKVIRAKIQQKGSDCYFYRLDQLIIFLEKNQPVITLNLDDNDKVQINKLSVIYLLEMAATGLGADQRSFGERARRILKSYFNAKSGEIYYFYEFYDLLSRYSIGLGFQHEGRSRKAVLEYNWIIKKLKDIWDNHGNILKNKQLSGDDKQLSDDELAKAEYITNRNGIEYLYLPAVLGRTGIEIKLQLAYHAVETVDNYWKETQNQYLSARKGYLLAEANRLMGAYEESKEYLQQVYKILIYPNPPITSTSRQSQNEWKDQLKQINDICEQKWPNIQSRLFDTYIALHLDELKDKESKASAHDSLESIYDIFSVYWRSIQWQAPNRQGYFELLAAYLGWAAEQTKFYNNVNNFKQLNRLYTEKKELLIPAENQNDDNEKNEKSSCPLCSNLGIKLDRWGSSHYQDYVSNIREYYNQFKQDLGLEKDDEDFRERLFKLEINRGEDSAHQKRKMAISQINDKPNDWCKKCLGQGRGGSRKMAFSGLLECCADKPIKKINYVQNDTLSLNSINYEHLMDNWDRHFCNHLEIESVHLPRCKAIHLLGLQRWNSTSPAIGRSLGGGYLMYHTDRKGKVDLAVAIDPGFDFVRNLFHLGFSLSDIDVVLMSHAHLDHIRDFESLVTLCLELKKRHPDKVKRRLHTIMTLGVYRRLSHIFASPGLREFVEPYIMDIEKEIKRDFIKPYIEDLEDYKLYFSNPEKITTVLQKSAQNSREFNFYLNPKWERNSDRGRFRYVVKNNQCKPNFDLSLTVAATRAYHNDFSNYSDSFGFKITLSTPEDNITIGYTGDTSWSPDIIDQYKGCDALIVHIGSLIDREGGEPRFDKYKKDGKECWKLIKKKNHPYLFGLLRFLTDIESYEKIPLVLLSEFGEELRGRIRLDLFKRLKDAYWANSKSDKKIHLLPLDVGLDILLCVDKATSEDKLPTAEDLEVSHLKKLLKGNDSFLVKCVNCEKFIAPQQVEFETYGHDEALYCVCQTCLRSTPHNVLQNKLQDLYEVARPLQSH